MDKKIKGYEECLENHLALLINTISHKQYDQACSEAESIVKITYLIARLKGIEEEC